MRQIILTIGLLMGLHAAPVYDTSAAFSGTRFVGSGGGLVDGGGSAYNNLFLTWSIIPQPDLTYVYNYTIGGFTTAALSHVLIDLSDNCVIPASPGAALPGCITASNAAVTLGDWCFDRPGCQGQSNVGLPNDIVGAKFGSLPSGPVTISFSSPRMPVWGDFYAVGGQQYVYNLGNLDHSSGTAINFIARPDTTVGTQVTETPEPMTLALTGVALIGLGVLRTRRKR